MKIKYVEIRDKFTDPNDNGRRVPKRFRGPRSRKQTYMEWQKERNNK